MTTDTATEADMARLLRLDGVEYFVSRVPMSEHADPSTLAALADHLVEATEHLVPWIGFDAIAFGCTTGSVAVGPRRVAERIQSVKPGVPVLNPVDAAMQGLGNLGCRRIAVLTPYLDEVNAMLERYL
ncbi:MAG: Asp/Glu racemase, partial [bacterium]|nr:Asp/Glu racemase [bacterium]